MADKVGKKPPGRKTGKLSVNGGATWTQLVEKYLHPDSLPVYEWTPNREVTASSKCLIQVTSTGTPDAVARMEGPFILVFGGP